MKQKFEAGKDYIGVGGGVLIFNEKREVLLKKRSKNSKNGVGKWEKPGGKIEFGESSICAMKREIKEEVDLEIDIWGLLPHTDHILKGEGQHWMALNFLADIKRGTAKNMEPDKCDELNWFNLEKLPKRIAQPTREAIRNYSKKKYMKF